MKLIQHASATTAIALLALASSFGCTSSAQEIGNTRSASRYTASEPKAGSTPPPLGSAFFPWGFYTTNVATNIDTLCAANINIVHVTEYSQEQVDSYLEKLAACGAKVILELDTSSPDNFVGRLNVFKHHSNIYAYDVQDDCVPGSDWAKIKQLTDIIHDQDPGRLSFAACLGDAGAQAAANVDIAGVESYIATSHANDSPAYVKQYPDAYAPASLTHYGVGVLQSFPYGTEDQTLDPTPAQARYQAWSSVAVGARGIVWYSMEESNGTSINPTLPDRNPTLWNEYVALAPEITDLAAVWTGGEFTSVRLDADVTIGTWTYEGATYVVAANAQNGPRDVDVALPGAAATQLLSAERYEALDFASGRLRGTLPAYGVAVVRLD